MPSCQHCGEPWDLYHLLHDLPHEMADDGLVVVWQQEVRANRHPMQHPKHGLEIQACMQAVGWSFGASLASVRTCACCSSNGPRRDTEEGKLQGFLTDLMGDDVDAAEAMSDLGRLS